MRNETAKPKETVDRKAQPNHLTDEPGAPCVKDSEPVQQELDVSEKPSPKAKAQAAKKNVGTLAVEEKKLSLQARQPAVPKKLRLEGEATQKEKVKAEPEAQAAPSPGSLRGDATGSEKQAVQDERAEQQASVVGQGDPRVEHEKEAPATGIGKAKTVKEERAVGEEGKEKGVEAEKTWRFAKTKKLPEAEKSKTESGPRLPQEADEKCSKHEEQSLEGEVEPSEQLVLPEPSPRSDVEDARRERKQREGSTASLRSSRSSRSPRASESQAGAQQRL